MTFVYWVFEDTYRFEFPHNSGWVGVSEDPRSRWYSVRAIKKVPKARLVILYEGTREESRRREHQLRPYSCRAEDSTNPGRTRPAVYRS